MNARKSIVELIALGDGSFKMQPVPNRNLGPGQSDAPMGRTDSRSLGPAAGSNPQGSGQPGPDGHMIDYTGSNLGPARGSRFEVDYTRGFRGKVGCSGTPESFLGGGCRNDNWQCDRSRMLPPWLSTSDGEDVAAVINDYTTVGTIGQMRAAFDVLYGLGAFDTTRYAGVLAGQNMVSTVTVLVPCVAVRLDWGVSMLNWAPFDLQVVTTGFTTLFGAQAVDRNFTIRVAKTSGSAIYAPLAQRPAGMSLAQPLVAVPGAGATIEVRGLPAAIAPSFNLQAALCTAFHPITAAFGESLGVLDGAGH